MLARNKNDLQSASAYTFSDGVLVRKWCASHRPSDLTVTQFVVPTCTFLIEK